MYKTNVDAGRPLTFLNCHNIYSIAPKIVKFDGFFKI